MAKVILNGELIDEAEATVSIADKGYWFDFAVYASLKGVQGKTFSTEYHIERLFESARLIELGYQFTQAEVKAWLNRLIEADSIKDALLSVVLIGDPDNVSGAKLFIFKVSSLTFYPDKFYKDGIKTITYPAQRRIPQAKTKDLLLSFLALRKAKKQGAPEALHVDDEGNIREGTRTNFYAVKDRVIFTDSLDKVVAGIAQKNLLAAVKDDFEVKYQDIPLANLDDYDEFFISSTSMNIMLLRQIDNTVFDTDFPQTRQIQKLFKNFHAREIFSNQCVHQLSI